MGSRVPVFIGKGLIHMLTVTRLRIRILYPGTRYCIHDAPDHGKNSTRTM